MLIITSIKITETHRRVINGRLCNLKSGDVLKVAQYPGDTAAHISALDAGILLEGDKAEECEERELEDGEEIAPDIKRGEAHNHVRIRNFDTAGKAA